MSFNLPLYEGARPQSPQQQWQELPALPHVQGFGEALDHAVSQGVKALLDYSELHDFGVEQENVRRQREIDESMQSEFDRRMELAPGAKGGFYNEEGHLDEEELKGFSASWQEKRAGLARPFWLRKNAMRAEEGLRLSNDELNGRVFLLAAKQEGEKRARLFQENFSTALERGDALGAMGLVNRAREAQQITDGQARALRRQVACMTARSSAAEAREAGPEATRELSRSLLLSLQGGGVSPAAGAEGGEGVVMSPTGSLLQGEETFDLTAAPEAPGALMLSVPEVTEGLSGLPAEEFSQTWRSLYDVSRRPVFERTPEGEVRLVAPPGASEQMQVLCDASGRRGGIDRKGFREAVLFRASYMACSSEYGDLDTEVLKNRLMEETYVAGLGEELFADAAHPDLEYRSMLKRTIDAAFSLRDGSIKAHVDTAFDPAVSGVDAVSFPTVSAIRFSGEMDAASASRLLAGVKEVYRARAAEEVYKYRMKNGGDGDSTVHWADEQQVIADTMRRLPLKEAIAIAQSKESWREGRVEFLKKRAHMMRQAMKATDPALREATEYRGRERSGSTEIRGDETAGAGGTEAGARPWPVLQRGRGALPAVMSCPVSFGDDGEEEPTLTMPSGLFARLRADLGLGEDEEALVSLQGGEGLFPVRPASVSAVSMNAALLQSVFGGRDLTAAELARLVKGQEELELRFEVV